MPISVALRAHKCIEQIQIIAGHQYYCTASHITVTWSRDADEDHNENNDDEYHYYPLK